MCLLVARRVPQGRLRDPVSQDADSARGVCARVHVCVSVCLRVFVMRTCVCVRVCVCTCVCRHTGECGLGSGPGRVCVPRAWACVPPHLAKQGSWPWSLGCVASARALPTIGVPGVEAGFLSSRAAGTLVLFSLVAQVPRVSEEGVGIYNWRGGSKIPVCVNCVSL